MAYNCKDEKEGNCYKMAGNCYEKVLEMVQTKIHQASPTAAFYKKITKPLWKWRDNIYMDKQAGKQENKKIGSNYCNTSKKNAATEDIY